MKIQDISKGKALKLVIALFLIIGLLVLLTLNKKQFFEREQDIQTFSKTFKFVFEVQNKTNNAVKDASFSTYLPVTNAFSQTLLNTKVSSEHQIKKGDDGNQIVEIPFDVIPPFATKKIVLSVDLETSFPRKKVKLLNKSKFLISEEFIESEHPSIKELAEKLKKKTAEETARSIFDWVSEKVKDSGYTSQDKGALYALQQGKGDCTEYMYLTIALARAAGLPARGVGGYVYPASSVAKSADYHNWAEVYFEGKWNIIDAQKKVFLEKPQDYITMRYLSDKESSLLGSSHRFSVVSNDLLVKMK